jgi:AcrR family transcriptional regulator
MTRADPQAISSSAAPRDKQRHARRAAVNEAKRTHILAAARAVFQERGLEGANLREIARRAGYVAGSIYSYFDSKEAIYGALLAESLERLNAAVAAGAPESRSARERARGAARAFYDFYATNPRDLDLGFYLFGGIKPQGLTPDLNAALNARLRDALARFGGALRELGMPEPAARSEEAAFFAHCVGLLLLENTRRIRMFQEDPGKLCDAYIERAVERAAAGAA